MKFRPLNDLVLVKIDKPAEMRGGLIIVPDASVNNIRTATVLRIGPGKVGKGGHRIPTGLEVGEKVAFLRWHLEHQNGKAQTECLRDLGDDVGLIKVQDILCTWPATEKVDVT